MEIKLKTLTPLWTGGVKPGEMDRIHETGIIGSLRWWYEAIVRGLKGYACDPTSDQRCIYDPKKGEKSICACCSLFGCTGLSRKFRFEIREDDSNKPGALVKEAIKGNQTLWLIFRPIRPIAPEEETLVWKTIQLIAEYGAIGGKTTLKPSETLEKNKKRHHEDFGLIKLLSNLPSSLPDRSQVDSYVRAYKKNSETVNELWPNIRNFWFIEKTLTRDKHNAIVNRPTSNTKPNDYLQNTSELQKWLGGKQRDSKKIFSFHSTGSQRSFGYAKEGQLDEVIELIKEKTEWENSMFKRGSEVIDELF